MSADPATTRRLEAQMSILARRVRRVAHERAADLSPSLGALGYAVLEHLRSQGSCRQTELATTLYADKGAVSRAVQTLLDLGLVERATDPDDGRAHLIVVTPRAEEQLAAHAERRRARFVARFDDWAPEELEQFVDLLTRYNTTLESPRT
ncbi:MarR family winged helix-turn-helix transcriptional regulator [Nocardioides sp.]|uniref:MarR family winged helix-turn-helix transcriptional regulator n=1 Tax=Nocardioides sp. TaxID=35761 RepID=UPI0027373D45|nr:MarR family winged helix-turn-helix transcriptional regulator [Nocardioides sp.]MDP3892390.1 MarR family winged helix-turn-helix transcriptional regulator [Nocardioides sp.]